MRVGRFSLSLSLVFVSWCLSAGTVEACSCAPSTPCASLRQADVAFLGTVIALEGETARFRVEQAWKGAPAAELSVSEDPMCGLGARQGERHVVFARRVGRSLWRSPCSGWVVTAQRPAPVFPARGTVVGRVTRPRYAGRADLRAPIVGAIVSIAGGIPVRTDADGRFRLAGVDLTRVQPLRIGLGPDDAAPSVEIGPGSHDGCTEVNVDTTPTGHLCGRIVDRAGRPVTALPVRAVPTGFGSTQPDATQAAAAWTDAAGEYVFRALLPGRYIVSVNDLDGPTTTHPYRPRFHPNADRRDAATAILVQGGKPVRLPPLALGDTFNTVQQIVEVRCRDGSIPSGAHVSVAPEGRPAEARSMPTDRDGRASIRILDRQRHLFTAQLLVRSRRAAESDGVFTAPPVPVLVDGRPITVTAPLDGCAAPGGPASPRPRRDRP